MAWPAAAPRGQGGAAPLLALCVALVMLVAVPAAGEAQPRSAAARCFYIQTHSDAKEPRYLNNIHHQSEYILPAIDGLFKLTRGGATWKSPHTIVTSLSLLPWSRSMLQLAAPRATIVHKHRPSDAAARAALKACGRINDLPRSGRVPDAMELAYMTKAASFDRLRGAAEEVCGVAIPRPCSGATTSPLRIGILNRHRNRQIADPDGLAAALSSAFSGAVVEHRTTSDNATFCEQVRWFSGVDVLVAAHGQALTTSVFMPRGASLVEVMPWSLGTRYTVYKAALIGSGVHVKQVVAHRQPSEAYQSLRGGVYSQEQCHRSAMCSMWHRDHANLTLDPAEIVSALRSLKAPRTVCQGPWL